MTGIHIAALVELGLGGRVDGGAEGVDPVEALTLEGANILAEQGQHQCLLGLEHLQTAQQDPAQCQPQDQNGHDGDKQPAQKIAEGRHEYHTGDACDVAQDHQQQNGHAVFVLVQNLFVHIGFSSQNIFDIKIISSR